MAQGKYGLSLSAIAILAFILSFFGFIEVLVLVVAYALLIEKNPWLTRQTLQALYLSLAYKILLIVINWVFGGLTIFFGWFKASGIVYALSSIQGFISFLIHIGLFVLVLLAVLKLAKDKDAGIPIIDTWADKTMGLIHKATAPAAPAVPVTPTMPAAPAWPATPTWSAAPATPAAPAVPTVPVATPVAPLFQAVPVVPATPLAPTVPAKTADEILAEEGHVELFQSDDYEPVVVEENIEEIEETSAQSFQEAVPDRSDANGTVSSLTPPDLIPRGASSGTAEAAIMSAEQMKSEGHVELFENGNYEPVVVDEKIEETEETSAQHFQEATPKAQETEPVRTAVSSGSYTMPAAPVSTASELKPWFCTSCGQKNDGNFCMSCGKRRL